MNLMMTVLTAQEAPEESGGVSLLLPETNELIAGVIAFAIIFFVVWRWALPVLSRTLEARQAAIAGQLEEAEKAKSEAESLLDDYRKQLAGAREEGGQIIDEARQSAETMKDDIVTRANSEAEQIVSKARDDAEAEKARAMSSARQDMADLSLDLAEKVVGESLDRDAQQDLIDRYLADLERL